MKTKNKAWVQGDHDGRDVYTDDSKETLVAEFHDEEDAALVVHVVNNYAELLEALRKAHGKLSLLTRAYQRNERTSSHIIDLSDHLHEAIAKATDMGSR